MKKGFMCTVANIEMLYNVFGGTFTAVFWVVALNSVGFSLVPIAIVLTISHVVCYLHQKYLKRKYGLLQGWQSDQGM